MRSGLVCPAVGLVLPDVHFYGRRKWFSGEVVNGCWD